ncbi:MAG: TolC family protein, partial [Woeseiaceae bacterium]
MNIRALLVLVAAFALPGAAQAASLLEIYQQALQSDPQIHEAEARRLAALEAKPQARGAYLPQVSLGADWTRSEFDGTSVEIDSDGSIGSLTSSSESEVRRWQFTLRQSLFRWDQIVGLRRADKLVARA